MKKKSIIFLVLSSVLFLLLLFILILTIVNIYLNDNKTYFSDKEYTNKETQDIKDSLFSYQTDIFYDHVIDGFNDYIIVKKNNLCGIIDKDNNIIESINNSCKFNSIILLQDHYYVITINDELLLKRNGKVVSKLTNFDTFELYKDSSDANSKYISYTGNDSYHPHADNKINDEFYYANYDSLVVIYNSITGEAVKTLEGNLSLFENTDLNSKYMLFTDGKRDSTTSYSTLFNKETLDLINTLDNYTLYNYNYEINLGRFQFNSDKYFVIYNEKYGVIDYENNLVIPLEYDYLTISSNNDKYIAAKKNGLYGLVDFNNKTILDFKYVMIKLYDNYILAVSDNKIDLYTKNLKLIKSNIVDVQFSSYVCNDIPLVIQELENSFIISSTCANKPDTTLTTEGKVFTYDSLNYIFNPFTNNNYYLYYEKNEDIYSFKILDNNTKIYSTFNIPSKDFYINYVSSNFIDENSIQIEISYDTVITTTNYPYYRYYIYDINDNTIHESDAIYSYPNNSKFTYLNKDYHYATEYLTDSKTFLLNIYDEDNNVVKRMKAKEINYLFDNYFAIKSNDEYWYIDKIDL